MGQVVGKLGWYKGWNWSDNQPNNLKPFWSFYPHIFNILLFIFHRFQGNSLQFCIVFDVAHSTKKFDWNIEEEKSQKYCNNSKSIVGRMPKRSSAQSSKLKLDPSIQVSQSVKL